jgi:hypothetical protein
MAGPLSFSCRRAGVERTSRPAEAAIERDPRSKMMTELAPILEAMCGRYTNTAGIQELN